MELLYTNDQWDEISNLTLSPDGDTVEKVFLTREDMEITLTTGRFEVEVEKDDEKEEIISDVAPYIQDSRTVLPFRAIAEAFGAEVGYETDNGRVSMVWFKQ